jgi:ABC-2 type transport system permease protein
MRENFALELRYWNLIGKNSGLLIFVYALIIIGGVYYQQWLSRLPAGFPGVTLVSATLALLTVRAPIRSFVRRADLVFLTPAEAELAPYFRKSKRYSLAVQSLFLLIVLLILSPILFRMWGQGSRPIAAVVAVLLALKVWNIDCHWQELTLHLPARTGLLRFALTFALIYGIADRLTPAISLAFAAAALALSIALHRQGAGGQVNWAGMIDMEEQAALRFLRFANLFTDVPQLRHGVRPRRLLSLLFPVRRFDAAHVDDQLLVKTFLRSDDYFGPYIRLTLVGAITCYFVHIGYFTVFLAVSFIFITGLQLLPLWKHPFPQALAGLYPIPGCYRRRAMVRLVLSLLLIESVPLAAAGGAGMASLPAFVWLLSASAATAFLFSCFYLRRKLAKTEQ